MLEWLHTPQHTAPCRAKFNYYHLCFREYRQALKLEESIAAYIFNELCKIPVPYSNIIIILEAFHILFAIFGFLKNCLDRLIATKVTQSKGYLLQDHHPSAQQQMPILTRHSLPRHTASDFARVSTMLPNAHRYWVYFAIWMCRFLSEYAIYGCREFGFNAYFLYWYGTCVIFDNRIG